MPSASTVPMGANSDEAGVKVSDKGLIAFGNVLKGRGRAGRTALGWAKLPAHGSFTARRRRGPLGPGSPAARQHQELGPVDLGCSDRVVTGFDRTHLFDRETVQVEQ